MCIVWSTRGEGDKNWSFGRTKTSTLRLRSPKVQVTGLLSCTLHCQNVNSSSCDFTFPIPLAVWIQKCPLCSVSACSPSFDDDLSPRPKGKKKKRKSERKRKRKRSVPSPSPKQNETTLQWDVLCGPLLSSFPEINKLRGCEGECKLELTLICCPASGLLPTACRHCARRKRRRRRAPRKASGIGRSLLLQQYWQNGMTFNFNSSFSFCIIPPPGIPPKSQNAGMYMPVARWWMSVISDGLNIWIKRTAAHVNVESHSATAFRTISVFPI